MESKIPSAPAAAPSSPRWKVALSRLPPPTGEAVRVADQAVRERERRERPRLRTVYRIAKVIRDRAAGLWRVRNISDYGMMLLTRMRPRRGERLFISLSEKVAIEAQVVWCRDDSCGVQFDRPIDSAALLRALVAEQAAGESRAPRVGADLAAAAWCDRGIHSIRVDNVSQNGLGFSHDGWARDGMVLLVRFAGGIERRGIVRWSDGTSAGLQLLDPLSTSELERLGLA